ncbi:esterase family protein [Corynebacterium yudongzhengii]|uniref:Esterase family protein n=1 Tax=Corynebacterium yudongzhengii TaxID=2080740 RepID=A0A2U1T4R7_9CORY|nr:alpha/beta hydrolase family protein [Corynebacterium yudongzhengii]AWB81125.1 esterase family protein [Corynebacterium yudongzhengii]PWC00983.1 esterase family protein [Corynebacterium yudongzhengii]
MKKLLRSLAAPTAAVALALTATPTVLAQGANTATATAAATVTELTEPSPDVKDRKWWKIATESPDVEAYSAYSPAMDREIPLAVIPATNEAGERVEGAPIIYMLNGAGGAEQNNDWLTLNPTTDDNLGTIDFYKGKGVNVVIPMAGAFSYYLDWVSEPNGSYLKGPQMWETFLTKELPGPLESTLNAGEQRGIIGFSMSALPALLYAAHNPDMYGAVAGFSGHYQTTSPIDHAVHSLTLDRGGATVDQMLGPIGGPRAAYNDVVGNAHNLHSTAVYVSNGSGLAAETDLPGYYIRNGAPEIAASANAAVLQVEGGVIEGATNHSTHNLKAKLDQHGIDAVYNFRNTGTHSWPNWRADVHESWPVFEQAFFG